MKKFALSLAVAALMMMAGSVSAQEWQEVKLLEKASIKMGGTPFDETKDGRTGKKSYLADSTALGSILVNFADFGLDEAMLNMLVETEQFEEQYKTGVTAGGAEVVSTSKGKVADKYPYLQYELKQTKDGKSETVHMRSVFYKSYAIGLIYHPGKKGKDDEVMNKYFNSITLAD